jgi:hypothetical protein
MDRGPWFALALADAGSLSGSYRLWRLRGDGQRCRKCGRHLVGRSEDRGGQERGGMSGVPSHCKEAGKVGDERGNFGSEVHALGVDSRRIRL